MTDYIKVKHNCISAKYALSYNFYYMSTIICQQTLHLSKVHSVVVLYTMHVAKVQYFIHIGTIGVFFVVVVFVSIFVVTVALGFLFVVKHLTREVVKAR